MSHFPADDDHCDKHRLHRLPCPMCLEDRRDDWLQTGFPSEEDWHEAYHQVIEERNEARLWAWEFKRIGRAMWCEEWESEDVDKMFDEWPTLPGWLRAEGKDGE